MSQQPIPLKSAKLVFGFNQHGQAMALNLVATPQKVLLYIPGYGIITEMKDHLGQTVITEYPNKMYYQTEYTQFLPAEEATDVTEVAEIVD